MGQASTRNSSVDLLSERVLSTQVKQRMYLADVVWGHDSLKVLDALVVMTTHLYKAQTHGHRLCPNW